MMNHSKAISSGIKENLFLFSLLIVINFFVGSMVGLERTVLPLLGEKVFGLSSASATFSFIMSFGFSKAVVNFFAGKFSEKIGRKQVLIIGWLFGMFVPAFIIWADSWVWIIIANVFLGINQGLAWSMTLNMKVDLAKPNQRGLAIGLNEFIGYGGLSLSALLSGYLATHYSLRHEPFYLGFLIVACGLLLSLFTKDTALHLVQESKSQSKPKSKSTYEVLQLTTWKHKTLSSISFAGLTTNLKDGMVWGLFPLYFITRGLDISQIGLIVAIYPASWGLFQIFTGLLSDKIGRKWLIVCGMGIQGAGIWMILLSNHLPFWLFSAIILGLGTAMVYPVLPAAISDIADSSWRATSMGIYRFWRDSGYGFGALIAGILTDLLNVKWSMGLVGILPFVAGAIVAFRTKETLVKNFPM